MEQGDDPSLAIEQTKKEEEEQLFGFFGFQRQR